MPLTENICTYASSALSIWRISLTTAGYIFTFSSKAKVMDIASFYKEELKKNGFKPEPGMEDLINEKGGMLKWNKAERDVELMMSFNSESNSTDIVLSYKEKK